ncbi:MAG: hypothetical protein MJ000_00425 [Bacteroidales bacterium]|nr:hypothetical protein [Bacteroidales bacterium]
MKKTLSIMIMAAALLLMTQCRKDEMPAVMPEANTVRMTVTAGPGSKTDITPAGAIKWSDNDKIYVGHNGTYVGYLTLVSSAGSATGTFSGDVALTGITDGTEQTFHFYYLGSAERTLAVGDGSAEVDFSSQNIYNNNGKLENASAQHVGYGTAKGTVKDGVVTGINVTLVSKVALARFSFTKDGADYTDALTLNGDNIYNEMTVDFAGTFKGKTTGNITLGSGNAERYVMLVPTGDATEQTLTFAGSSDEGEGKVPGLQANKLYGMKDAIAVTLEAAAPAPKFSVGENSTVEFAPDDLYWDGSAFHFEANQCEQPYDQWDCTHVRYFYWSNSESVAYGESYSDGDASESDVFFTNDPEDETKPNANFQVSGQEKGTWRTLSIDEWDYLLHSRANASSLCGFVCLDDGVNGFVILPDKSDETASGVTTTKLVADSGAVFFPIDGGYRVGTTICHGLTSSFYWSSTSGEYSDSDQAHQAHAIDFEDNYIYRMPVTRDIGSAVRLVR